MMPKNDDIIDIGGSINRKMQFYSNIAYNFRMLSIMALPTPDILDPQARPS